MTESSAVSASELSKTYKLYSSAGAWLSEVLLGKEGHDRIEALHAISFELSPGRSLGVIGDNGAGKTTLLKLLAGTTFPTSGSLSMSGRVSALLELGSGFHPEFTGRENVLFSAALAGYGRAELTQRLDEILEFSELGDFVERPVKTYSSGMFVRLGFAVATGFDPQVLVIDESLAVGDQTFQKKCTDRIMNFKRSGVTIVFCSHNLHQVKTLCEQVIWLKNGRTEALGPANEVCQLYEEFCREKAVKPRSHTGPAGTPRERQLCWIEKTNLVPSSGGSTATYATGDTLQLDIEIGHSADFKGEPAVGVAIIRSDGEAVYVTATTFDDVRLAMHTERNSSISIIFPRLPLLSGLYSFNVVTSDENSLQAYDILEGIHPFRIKHPDRDSGLVRLSHRWQAG